MIQTQQIVVDGATYSVTQFSATKGMKLLTRLTKILGEPMSVFMSDENADAQKVLPVAIAALSERLEEDMVVQTVKELMDGVRDSDGPIQFDTHFAGKFGHLFKLLAKILEVQYGDFFGALIAKGSALQQKQAVPMRKKTR
jgi:hypothetical protein